MASLFIWGKGGQLGAGGVKEVMTCVGERHAQRDPPSSWSRRLEQIVKIKDVYLFTWPDSPHADINKLLSSLFLKV